VYWYSQISHSCVGLPLSRTRTFPICAMGSFRPVHQIRRDSVGCIWYRAKYFTDAVAPGCDVVIEQRRLKTRRQESRAVARKQRDAAAVLFGLKFADSIHYTRLRVAKLRKTGFRAPKILALNRIWRKMAIQGHSRSRVLESVERR